MKKDLQKLLGKDFSINGSDTRMEVTDKTIQGYDPERNVAKIEVRNGSIFVNVYRGYFYKQTEYVEAKDLNEVKALIEGRKKGRSNG